MSSEGTETRERGKVKWFSASKGYGFIVPDGSEDGAGELFVHQTAIECDGFRTLEEGEEVSYVREKGPKGMQATRVQRVGERADGR